MFIHFSTDFIRHECKLLVAMSPMYLAKSFMTLYTCLLDEIKEHGNEGSDAPKMTSAQVCEEYTFFMIVAIFLLVA